LLHCVFLFVILAKIYDDQTHWFFPPMCTVTTGLHLVGKRPHFF
jgi:hypothetical protein